MKLPIYLIGVLAGTTIAYPGMGNLLRELVKRQADDKPVRMIGDLVERATSDVGSQIQDCLTGAITCQLLTPKVRTPEPIKSLQANIYSHTLHQTSTVRPVPQIHVAYGIISRVTWWPCSPIATARVMILHGQQSDWDFTMRARGLRPADLAVQMAA